MGASRSSPTSACLVCRDRIDIARAGAEQLPPDERASRQAEGYAPELGGVEPTVIAYTSAVASFTVAELLERLIGYGPDPEPEKFLCVATTERSVRIGLSPSRSATPTPPLACSVPATVSRSSGRHGAHKTRFVGRDPDTSVVDMDPPQKVSGAWGCGCR